MKAATSEFGTFPTSRDVRLESGMRAKADVGGTGDQGELDNATSFAAVTLTG